MSKPTRLLTLILCTTIAGCTATLQSTHAPSTSAADPSFLKDYAETFRFRRGAPTSITPLNDGSILFLQSPPRSPVQSLMRFDPASRSTSPLFAPIDQRTLTTEEKARLERTRSTARGIRSFEYHPETNSILIPLGVSCTIYNLATKESFDTQEFDAPLIDPQLSPDGALLAYVRNGDLYSYNIISRTETRLTLDASEHITSGLAEFVAQEEMDRQHGFWWSPDSQRILYQRTDTAALETFSIADPRDPAKPAQTWPYPRAGTANAEITLHIASAAGGSTVDIHWDREQYPYIATVRWPKNEYPIILVQNREQTEQSLLAVARTRDQHAAEKLGERAYTKFTESDSKWLNLDQQMPRFFESTPNFLWTSERKGAWQLELHTMTVAGYARVALTPPTPNYRGICHVDETNKRVIYRAADDPRFANLYSADLAYEPSAPTLLTPNQPGIHDAVFSKDGKTLVHTFIPLYGEPQYLVRRVTDPAKPLGEIVASLPNNAERPATEPNLSLETIDHPDGPFYAALIKPRNFSPARKYPVIVHVYAGPHAQRVSANPSQYFLDQYIADHGFIVCWIDGRGTPYRGRDWERTIKGNFIDIPLQDQVNAFNKLAESHPEMDTTRVGIFGWSFGGYFSAMAAMRAPETFKCAVAGAPVCEWEDYDTHYTERYIGTPQANPEAYEVSNVLTYADQLAMPLLIIHGTADDNVYMTHSLKMSDALTRKGIDHDFLPLAGHTHLVAEPEIVEQLYTRIIRFFQHHLMQTED